MSKKISTIITTTIVILSMIFASNITLGEYELTETTTVSILPTSQTVEKGETFTVSVFVEPSEPIMGASFDNLSFDPNLIHANSVIESDLFDNFLFFNSGTIDNVNGKITSVYLVANSTNAVSNPGSFVDIEFTAQQEFGISPLDLEGVIIPNPGGDTLPLEVNNGTVTIDDIGEYFDLTINVVGSGTTTPSPGMHSIASGTVVSLEAFPDTGCEFTEWSGDIDTTDNPTTILMDGNKTVTATFITCDEYNLTIEIIGNGNVIKNPDQSTYTNGTIVELTAIPNFDSNFIEWSDDLSGSNNPENIIMDGDKNVTATFAYKIPGVDIFEGGSKALIGATDSNDVIITLIEDLCYGKTIDIEVNEDDFDWGSDTTYRLYYSEYVCTELDDDYELIWNLWKYDSGVAPKIGGIYDFVFDDIHFNNSGLWIIDNDPTHDTSNRLQMNLTVPAWFWVNGTSDVLQTTLSDNNVDYNEEKEITISVTKDGEPYECLIDVRNSDNESIYDDIIIASETTFTTDSENFSCVGEYGIWTYDDLDETDIFYQEFPHHYDNTYGDGLITDVAINYNYANCGPWDPPEYMTEKTLEIEESKPSIIVDPDILYWGFRNTLYINITDNKGNGLDNIDYLRIENDEDIDVTQRFNGNITSGEKAGDFEITFPHGADEWAKLGGTGTWCIFYEEDINGDGILEWSHKESFTVRGESQGVTIYVIDDGDGNRDMKVDVPVFDGMDIQPINISFRIYGESVDDVFDEEDKDDITVSGDIIEEETLEYDEDKNIWHAIVVPKNPGKIIVSVDWEDMGSDSVSIDVINGTYVSTDITAFPVGEDVTISVTVKDKDDDYVKYSHVSLFWEDNDILTLIETITGDGTEEKGKNGIYVFIIDKDEQGNNAPRDIYVTADTPEPNYWGYAKITMERNHELIVNCSPLVSYAGDETLYDIDVTTTDGTDPDNIIVELYREDDDPGEDKPVKGPWIGNSFEDKEIILDSGRYYFYAHNNTHDNKENDTILVIHSYTISCSPSVLAWNIDTEIDITFTVTPAGDGTLTIVNITGNDVAHDDGDGGEGDTHTINIENGTGTLEEIAATSLGNITFKYQPDGGNKYPAEGMLRVTTATPTPNPSTVYVNEPITVTITVTHPATGQPIPDVEVGLQSNILVSQPDNEITDANGQVQFGITTGGSGDITILIEGDFDPDNEFVIESKLRKTMIIDIPLTVEEGDRFIVNIKTLTGEFVTDLVTIEFADNTFTTFTGKLQLTAPMVSTDTDYRIRASATGYYNDEETIRVTAKPEIKQLSIVISDFTGEGKTTFKVIVIDDTGRSIVGATITFDGNEYQTTPNGVDLITPNKKGTYVISASFTGFESDSKSVIVTEEVENGSPGFELLTLVVSLGVCFILLRRRKRS